MKLYILRNSLINCRDIGVRGATHQANQHMLVFILISFFWWYSFNWTDDVLQRKNILWNLSREKAKKNTPVIYSDITKNRSHLSKWLKCIKHVKTFTAQHEQIYPHWYFQIERPPPSPSQLEWSLSHCTIISQVNVPSSWGVCNKGNRVVLLWRNITRKSSS